MDSGKSVETAHVKAPSSPDVRHRAPDLARGLMLLLIATANISYWLPASAVDPSRMDRADQLITIIRTPMADQAVYPLFSILLGFGIAVMARRYEAQSLAAGPDQVAARIHAVRRLRIRGALLVCFGACLGVFFTVEILGTYGLVTVLLAPLVVNRRHRLMIGLACTVLAVNVVTMSAAGSFGEPAGATTGLDPTTTPWAELVLGNISAWALNAVLAVPVSLVLPATLLGVWLASTDLLTDPQRHRRLLITLVIAGGVSAAGAVPFSLYSAGLAQELPSWGLATLSLGGLVTGVGWLALAALCASSVRFSHSRVATTVAILGQNSLSAYIGQIALMAAFTALTILGGSWPQMSVLDGFIVAVATWVGTLVICDALHLMGDDRPAERALRRLMSRLS